MQICKEIKKCKKHKNYKKMNLKFGRRYRSSIFAYLAKSASSDLLLDSVVTSICTYVLSAL